MTTRRLTLTALLIAAAFGLLASVRTLQGYHTAKYGGPYVDLPNAFLVAAPLAGVHWRACDRSGAVLIWANLRNASLYGVDLTGANLRRANLRDCFLGAIIHQTEFKPTILDRADLSGADLRGALLRGARLESTILKEAIYDAHTHWPKGFDPQAHGAILVE